MRPTLILACFLFFYNNLFAQADTTCSGIPKLNLYGYKDIRLLSQNYGIYNNSKGVKNTFAFYIDSKALLFMDTALKSLKNQGLPLYNGVNIHFISNKKRNYHQKEGDFQSRIAFTIAKKEMDGKLKMYYDVFQDFYSSLNVVGKNYFEYDKIDRGASCNGNCDAIMAKWQALGANNLNKLPFQYANEPLGVLFPSRQNLGIRIKKHKSEHGNEICDSCQTRSVFMSASKISRLASFFYRDAQTILEYPVIAIYYINYKGKVAPGQKKDDQMSVILVPMKWGENGFVPDPCEYLSHSQLAFLSENHGELCPDGCPEEGN